MKYIGVDGCHYGWFAVILEEARWQIDIFKDIFELWEKHHDAELILVDIPIGLPDNRHKKRSCDIKARKQIGERYRSVFFAPCRTAISATTCKEASEINDREICSKLSKQTWCIIPKIKEVDELLRRQAHARLCIYETHPEVCFWGLAGKKPMRFSKKDGRGFDERPEVLRSIYHATDKIVAEALTRYPLKDVARDDILDALAVAITASKQGLGLKSLPEAPEIDAKGLPMQIVYYATKVSHQSPLPVSD